MANQYIWFYMTVDAQQAPEPVSPWHGLLDRSEHSPT